MVPLQIKEIIKYSLSTNFSNQRYPGRNSGIFFAVSFLSTIFVLSNLNIDSHETSTNIQKWFFLPEFLGSNKSYIVCDGKSSQRIEIFT
nr:MAG TPA: hypothetical protein [Herelleviridae sp.]